MGEGWGEERVLAGGAMVAGDLEGGWSVTTHSYLDYLQGASLSTSLSTMEEERVSTTSFPSSLEPLRPQQHSTPILVGWAQTRTTPQHWV